MNVGKAAKLGGCALCILPVAAYVALIAIVFIPSKHRTDAANRAEGTRLVAALETWRAAHERYPRSLEELAAGEAQPLPQAVSNTGEQRPFDYAVLDSGASFALRFHEAPLTPMDDGAGLLRWDPKTNDWVEESP